jgi:hypothetical protein
VYRAAKTTIAGIDIGGAAKDTFAMLLGALAGKVAAKKMTAGGSELDIWGWQNYAWCLGGSFGAALLTSAIFKKRKLANDVMKGGFLITAYKLITRELTQHSAGLEEWFGQDADFDPYSTEGVGSVYGVGAQDYSPQLPAGYYGQEIEQAGPTMGQDIAPASAQMGFVGDVTSQFERAYG